MRYRYSAAGQLLETTDQTGAVYRSGYNSSGQLFPLSGGVRIVSNPVQQYEVGIYKDLQARSVSGDGLDIHHVPQKWPAGQVIDDYDWINAPSIALPEGEHSAIPTLRGNYTGTPQELIQRTSRTSVSSPTRRPRRSRP